jgi:hypothetical protein
MTETQDPGHQVGPLKCDPAPTFEQSSSLKLRLNELIWEYAPPSTTLGDADELACKVLNSIQAGKYLL